jgi:hypothetical protein
MAEMNQRFQCFILNLESKAFQPVFRDEHLWKAKLSKYLEILGEFHCFYPGFENHRIVWILLTTSRFCRQSPAQSESVTSQPLKVWESEAFLSNSQLNDPRL